MPKYGGPLNLHSALSLINPTSGSSLGNTTVVISGKYFVNDASTNCRFSFNGSTSDVPATVLNALTNISTVVCKTPPSFNNALSVSVDVVYQGVRFSTGSSPFLFTYYGKVNTSSA